MEQAKILKDAIDYVFSLNKEKTSVEPEVAGYLYELVLKGNVNLLAQWLHSDIIGLCLQESKVDDQIVVATKVYGKLDDNIKGTYIKYKALLDELAVRGSWRLTISRLARYKKEDAYLDALSKLSSQIGYSFYDSDIRELAEIFSTTDKERYREIIIELLTSCNFHSVVSDFENGLFEEYFG